MRAPLAAVAILLSAAAALSAQSVQGRLVEPGGEPVAQTLVVLVDSAGRPAATALTDRQGGFTLRAPGPGSFTLRAERVGYATTVSPAFPLAAGETAQQRLVANDRTASLAGIVAVGDARRCTVRPGGGEQTATVWNEARKALSAAAFGERQRLFRYRVAQFQRDLDPASGRVLRETRSEQATVAAHPFASPPAAELSARGWIQKTADGTLYYGPDATVLVSDEFLNDHCMRLEDDRKVAGDSLVGVAFEPVGGRRQPDVRGVLWLHRATAELRRVEYVYTSLPAGVASPRLGGTVEYARLDDGPWIVRRWSIRMPQVEVQQGMRTTPSRDADIYTAYENARLFAIREDGGEVLSTSARSGAAVLGAAEAAVEGVVWDSTRAAPLAGARVFVSGTALEAVSDSAGRFRLAGLRGGTYTVMFSHYRLGPAAAAVRPATVTVEAGATAQVRLAVPGLAAVAAAVCPSAASQPFGGIILGSIRGPEGTVAGATVRSAWSGGFVASVADPSGGFALCGVPEAQDVVLTAGQPTGAGARARVRLAAGTPLQRDLLLAPGAGGEIAEAAASPAAVPVRGVTATGRSSLADFQRRRRGGRGLFLTREQIAARNAHRTADVFQGLPGVRMVDDGRGGLKIQMTGAISPGNLGELRPQTQNPAIRLEDQRQVNRNEAAGRTGNEYPTGAGSTSTSVPASERAGAGDCQVQFFVDGTRFYPSREGDISGDVPLSLIEALEVYRNVAETPVEFRGGNSASCGTVVIWTQAPPPR